MNPCTAVEEHLFAEGAALPPALAEHVRGCEACQALVRDVEAMRGLVERARHEARALPDLSPAAWARVRAAAEAVAAPPSKRWGLWGWGVAAAAALAVSVWAVWGGSPAGRHHVGPAGGSAPITAGASDRRSGPGERAAPHASRSPRPALAARSRAASDGTPRGGAAEAAGGAQAEAGLTVLVDGAFARGRLVEGATVETGPSAATVLAFGRHLVRFDPGTVVRVGAWEPDAVALEVQRGAIRCDVERARDAERFTVRAGDAEVRVLGTIFTVARLQGEVSVQVQRGRVAVARPGAAVVSVGAGERWALGALWTGASVGPAVAPAPTPPLPVAVARPAAATRRPARSAGHRARVGVAASPSRSSSSSSPGARPAPHVVEPHVVEIVVPDQQAGPPAAPIHPADGGPGARVEPVPGSVRKLLVPVVATIRAGGCQRAVPRLRAIAESFAERTPPDVLYLLGWCYRHEGKNQAADAFFERYRGLVSAPRWPLPRDAEEELPVPSAARLAP